MHYPYTNIKILYFCSATNNNKTEKRIEERKKRINKIEDGKIHQFNRNLYVWTFG